MKSIDWKQNTSGKRAFVGKIAIGKVWHNGIDRDDNLRYVCATYLPGFKETQWKLPTEQEAMKRIESVTKIWFKETE